MKKAIFLFCSLLFTTTGIEAMEWGDSIRLTYKLHGQTRRFNVVFTPTATDGAVMNWEIERNLKIWRGSYTMSAATVANATGMSFLMPEDGNHVILPDSETFAILSKAAFESLRHKGMMNWGGTEYRLDDISDGMLHATDINEGARITVLDNLHFPLVTSMQNNPLEINWTSSPL